MRDLWKIFVAIGLILALTQGPDLSEAKKIKKIVKELKKLKKYAYLLAANKKKLYAIPFPMPLPVFVKRQHIYTQVPIIPRYVQQPQPYGGPSLSTEASFNYELVAGNYAPEMHSASYSKDYHPSTSSPSSSSTHGVSSKRPSSSSSASSNGQNDLVSHYLSASSKYLSQIANLMGQSGPVSGNMNKDLISKLLSGQARVLTPSALLSILKSPGSTAAGAKTHGYEKQQEQQHQHQDQEQQDQDSKAQSQSSSGGGGGGGRGAITYDDAAGNSTGKSEYASDNRPSASEIYKTSTSYGPMRSVLGPIMNPHQIPAMMGQVMSPIAALARAQIMSSRMPPFRAPIGNDMMSSMYAYDGANQIDSPPIAHESQEMSSSSPQDHESAANREYPHPYEALLKQRRLQHQLQPDQVLLAVDKMQRQQLLARQQNALKMALLRDQEVAARLAESRQVLVRAHQLGLPLAADHPNFIKQYRHLIA